MIKLQTDLTLDCNVVKNKNTKLWTLERIYFDNDEPGSETSAVLIDITGMRTVAQFEIILSWNSCTIALCTVVGIGGVSMAAQALSI